MNISGMAICVFTEQDKIFVNAKLIDRSGLKCKSNNWTLDILTEQLLLTIIENILYNHKNIEIIYLGFSGSTVFVNSNSLDLSLLRKNFIKKISQERNIHIYFENNVNAAIYGYVCCMPFVEKDDTIIGISLPKGSAPDAGIIIEHKIYKGKYGSVGEIKNIQPRVNWDDLYNANTDTIKSVLYELINDVIDLFSPSKIILYCEYLNTEIINSFKSPIDIELKPSLKKDFEKGMTSLTYEALFLTSIIV